MQGGKNVYSHASHLFKNKYLYFVELRQRLHMEYKYQIHLFTFFTLFFNHLSNSGWWGFGELKSIQAVMKNVS